MFHNTYYRKNIVIIPKSNDKNSLKNKVDIKPNNKTYDNIRNIVQNDDKPVEINSISKKDDIKRII
jgi:hypothetical protein